MKFILPFFFLLILAPVYAQRVKPLLHLAKGETYYMSSSGTSAITQNIRGRENKINITLSFRMAFKVASITDTVYHMEVCYESINMKIHTEDTTINISSLQRVAPGEKKIKPDTASLLMAAMVNKPFDIALTAQGKVLWVKNLDKIIGGVFYNFQIPDTSKKELIKSRFIQSFGENAFRGSLEMGTAIFPNNAVAKNDKWTVNSGLSVPAKANVKTVYQLTDITADILQVHGEGVITTDAVAKSGDINGMPVVYNLNGGMMTDIKIDKKTGWINQVTLKQLIAGEVDIMDNPKMPGGMTIPMMFSAEVGITNK
ncbi:MAG TPA: DUF6263 family protein [Mucilaginibacter sp.]|nr:DUF6263 family protein [Mucilaginibacter sp.]